MADKISPLKRKALMSSIKSKNSKAELIVFKYLRKEAVYFQKHYPKALGTPDIALPRKKRAVFIDGDFWHGRRIGELLKGRGAEDYWTKKIQANIDRDKRQRAALVEQGWIVLAVWETDINRKSTRDYYLDEIKKFLLSGN